MARAWTTADLMVKRMAAEVRDGYVVGMGVLSPLVLTSYLFAKRRHAPNLYICGVASFAGDCLPSPSLSLDEFYSFRNCSFRLNSRHIYDMVLGQTYDLVFHGCAQIDARGNYNLTYIGDPKKPSVRLPGAAGTADYTIGCSSGPVVYMTRQSSKVMVEKVDFIDGVGHNGGTRRAGSPVRVVTNLATFTFTEGGLMELSSLCPGVKQEDVLANMGFRPQIAGRLGSIEPPNDDDIKLLDEIDPLGVRNLEFLSGAERLQFLNGILEKEEAIKREIRGEGR